MNKEYIYYMLLSRHNGILFAKYGLPLVVRMPHTAQITLQFYYGASGLFPQKYHQRLETLFCQQPVLQILFFSELGLEIEGDSDSNLIALAQKQKILTGRIFDWYGPYEHAAL